MFDGCARIGDGTSVIGDVRLPFAWVAAAARLSLVGSDGRSVVVADFGRNARHLVRGSVGSFAEPVAAHVMTEAQFLAGEDATDAFVVLEPFTAPRGAVLTAILDRGARGFLTDSCLDRFACPDAVPAVTGATENGNVSADCETRPFVGFALTPRLADKVRAGAASGILEVRFTCVARRFAGPLPEDPALAARLAATWETLPRAASAPRGRGILPRQDGEGTDLSDTASPWRAYAAGIVLSRTSPVVPCDLVRIPRARRMTLRLPFPESPLAEIAVRADGRTDLATLIASVEQTHGRRFDEASVRRAVLFLCLLGEYGYLGVTNAGAVTRTKIVAALRAAGVAEGDVLLVHSSLSALGYVEGGAETVIAALRDTVGGTGTVLFPAFSCSFRVLDAVNKLWTFRPYDRSNAEAVRWVGEVPAAFLRRHPDAPHSGHCTNAWTGFGPRAAELMTGHPADDAPYSARSPLAKALAADAKAVFLGADVTSCTFLHRLEDRFGLPGLAPALASVRGADGRPADVVLERQSSGPRDFYREGEAARIFREAKAAGLEIRRAPLGRGFVKVFSLVALDALGESLPVIATRSRL